MFSPKTPAEIESFAFGYDGLLAQGETIQSAIASIAVKRGEDPDVLNMLFQVPSINGVVVSVLVRNGVVGVIYCLSMEATTSNGQKLVLSGDFIVRGNC